MNINEDAGLDLSESNKGEVITLSDLLSDDIVETDKEKEETIEEDIDISPIEEKEEVKKESETIDIIDDGKSDTNKAFIRKMVALGKWQPIDIIEGEDGKEISFEDAVIDDEMFAAITEDQEASKNEELLKDKISASGISEFTKNLIEIEKKGGDVIEALRVYNTIKNPLNALDLTNVADQEKAVIMLNQAKGLDDDTITTLVESYKTKGNLEDKAEESKKLLEDAYQKKLQDIDKQAADAIVQRKENLSIYRKELEVNLKNFEVNDNYKKKLLDAATKESKDGKFEVDNLYNEKRRDPKEAAELTMFLIDKEEYLKQKTNSKITEERINTQKKFKFAKSENKDSLNLRDKRKEEKDLIDLDNL